MKKSVLLLGLILVTSILTAQNYNKRYSQRDFADYAYASLHADVNMAFGIKDNKATAAPDRGFDWDLEIGARFKVTSVYMFYGQFNEFNWKNYGAGFDFTVQKWRDSSLHLFGKDLTKGIEFSGGLYTSFILRPDDYGTEFNYWAPFNVRGKVTIWLSEDLAFELVAKGQGRPDIGEFMKFEGQAGFKYKFDL